MQVVESPLSATSASAPRQVMFEADRGVSLRHPHVVQTFKTHTNMCKVPMLVQGTHFGPHGVLLLCGCNKR